MGWVRFVIAIAGLAALTAGAVELSQWSPTTATNDHQSHHLLVVTPQQTIYNGTINGNQTTPMALLEAAAPRNFTLEIESHAGYGECGRYVRAIGNYRADPSGRDTAGWVYHVRTDNEWQWGPIGAACYDLAPGQAVRWSWSSGGPS